MDPSLADRLRHETRSLHTAAERSAFMGALLRGQVDRAGYVALLRNLSAIYEALEPALARHAAHPLIAPVHAPALCRAAALAQDLAVLHGPHGVDELPLAPVTPLYVARLRTLDAEQPGLLLAHAYVRYLGDLSGGQMLRRVASPRAPSPASRASPATAGARRAAAAPAGRARPRTRARAPWRGLAGS